MNAPHMNDMTADAATLDTPAAPAGRPALTRREQ